MTLADLKWRWEDWREDALDRLWLWRFRFRRRLGLEAAYDRPAPPELQALLEALTANMHPYPFHAGRPCPLHPGKYSTPYASRCCYDPVLKVESLDVTMKCITFDASHIKLRKWS